MPEVSFEEEKQWETRRFNTFDDQPKLIRLILKTHIVKDPKSANYVLIGIALGFTLLAYFIISSVV
jgi:hypothetical protein